MDYFYLRLTHTKTLSKLIRTRLINAFLLSLLASSPTTQALSENAPTIKAREADYTKIQTMLLDQRIKDIQLQRALIKGFDADEQWQIIVTNDSFKAQTVRYQPQWFDTNNQPIENSGEWIRDTISAGSEAILTIDKPEKDADHLIIYLKR